MPSGMMPDADAEPAFSHGAAVVSPHDALAQRAAAQPDSVLGWHMPDGLAGGWQPFTAHVLHAQVGRIAARLCAAGVQTGEPVAVLGGRRAATIAAMLAVLQSGGVLVPLNTRLAAPELADQVARAGIRRVLHDAAHQAQAEAACPERAAVLAIDDPPVPDAAPGERVRGGALSPDQPSLLMFTSGTSGRPKAAQLTLNQLWASASASRARLGQAENELWLMPLPLYHIGGLSIVLRTLWYGGAFALPAEDRPSVEAVAHAFAHLPITLASLVPTQLYRLLEDGFAPPPALRLILLGGAAAAPSLLAEACRRGIPVATTYGLTEAASQVATARPAEVCAKPGAVGRPLSGTHVRIVGREGQALAPGEHGEIVVSGPTVMHGYLGMPPVDRAAGFATGDIGYLDHDGDLWVLQRRTDLIVSGGENIYPAEVEAVLRAHEAVADCCVVGVPDAEWGERVAAAVVVRAQAAGDAAPDEAGLFAALDAHCTARLARYKRPVRYRVVSALPLTASGKIARAAVRALFAD
jgi:O-succinylbenzoic acid--CoA ligase